MEFKKGKKVHTIYGFGEIVNIESIGSTDTWHKYGVKISKINNPWWNGEMVQTFENQILYFLKKEISNSLKDLKTTKNYMKNHSTGYCRKK